MTNTNRPAIIIGVGGSGVWTLTHLKKELQDSNGGRVPDNIKLIGFDTIYHPSAVVGMGNVDKDKTASGEARKRQVGAVQLEDRVEYIHIGYDLQKTTKEQRKLTGDPSKLDNLGSAALNCTDGAAAVRKVGRLCVVYDFAQGQNSRISKKIIQAMGELAGKVKPAATGTAQQGGLLDIFVIGSMAGGTGSGMLVDMGLICRYLKSLHLPNIPINLRAVIYTPRTFNAVPDNKTGGMFAASFAAWRELDRFIVTNQAAGATRVRYSDNLILSNNEFLYDVSYLVDPSRAVNPIASGNHEDQLYPGVANAIAGMIDKDAGNEYAADVINILATKAQNPNLTLHSALGSHVIKSARHYEEMTYTLYLAQKVLSDLLVPIFEGEQYLGLAEDKNPQNASPRIGANAASEFMFSDNTTINSINTAGQPVQTLHANTDWNKLISRAWREKWSETPAVINKHAGNNLADHQNGYKDVVDSVPDGSTAENILRANWGKAISTGVKTTMDLKRDPSSEVEKARIPKDIDDVRVDIITQYEKGLKQAHPSHVNMFKSRLRAEMDNILNGTLNDVIPNKTGRLGFAIGFIHGLKKVIGDYAAYIKKVQDQRATDGRLSRAVGREDAARGNYEKNIKECAVVYWDHGKHPQYRENQRTWLREADYRLKEELRERLLIQESLTIAAYQTELNKLENDLVTWEEYLAKGRILPDNHVVKGLYRGVEQELTNLDLNFKNDKLHDKVMDILTAIPQEVTVTHEQDVMKQLSWQVMNDGNGVTCVLMGEGSKFVNSGQEEADQYNLELMNNLIKPLAQITMQGRTFGTALKQIAGTPEALGDHLSRRAEPFYQMASGGAMLHGIPKSGKLCVNNQDNLFVYSETITKLNQLEQGVPDYKFRAIADEGKLTLLRTDDCIKSSDFGVYQMCRSKYEELANNPADGNRTVDLHVFPAETNACRYEVEISKITGENYKILHPRVVALMDDVEKFEGFFKAKALGFINPFHKEADQPFWAYEYEREYVNAKQVLVKEKDYIKLSDATVGIPDFYKLINQFVIEGRDIRPNFQNTVVNWLGFQEKYNTYLTDNVSKRKNYIDTMQTELGEGGMVAQIMSLSKAAGLNANAADMEVLTDLANVTRAVYTKLIEIEKAILEEMGKNSTINTPIIKKKAKS